jgi:hypothetical protein
MKYTSLSTGFICKTGNARDIYQAKPNRTVLIIVKCSQDEGRIMLRGDIRLVRGFNMAQKTVHSY